MAQLRSDIWCAAFVRRHNDQGNFCVVVRRGDAIAGQVFIEVDHLDGTLSLFTPAPTALRDDDAGRFFQARFRRAAAETVRDRIRRETEFDPDLWVLGLDFRGDDPGLDVVA